MNVEQNSTSADINTLATLHRYQQHIYLQMSASPAGRALPLGLSVGMGALDAEIDVLAQLEADLRKGLQDVESSQQQGQPTPSPKKRLTALLGGDNTPQQNKPMGNYGTSISGASPAPASSPAAATTLLSTMSTEQLASALSAARSENAFLARALGELEVMHRQQAMAAAAASERAEAAERSAVEAHAAAHAAVQRMMTG